MNRFGALIRRRAACGQGESLLSIKDQTKSCVTRVQRAYYGIALESKPGAGPHRALRVTKEFEF